MPRSRSAALTSPRGWTTSSALDHEILCSTARLLDGVTMSLVRSRAITAPSSAELRDNVIVDGWPDPEEGEAGRQSGTRSERWGMRRSGQPAAHCPGPCGGSEGGGEPGAEGQGVGQHGGTARIMNLMLGRPSCRRPGLDAAAKAMTVTRTATVRRSSRQSSAVMWSQRMSGERRIKADHRAGRSFARVAPGARGRPRGAWSAPSRLSPRCLARRRRDPGPTPPDPALCPHPSSVT